jgi:hypothetical protein
LGVACAENFTVGSFLRIPKNWLATMWSRRL